MDRYWHGVVFGRTTWLNLADYTAASTIKRLGMNNIHPKVLERAHLEQSGLPLNNQLCLRWDEQEMFENIVEHLDWSNIGVSTLLSEQNRHGGTPLIKAIPLYQMRCSCLSQLGQLNLRVKDFKKALGLVSDGFANHDFIRFYPSPVANTDYLGITVMCEAYLFDWEKKQRLPFTVEIAACYPRYINRNQAPFLSAKVDLNGRRTYSQQSEERFDIAFDLIERFVREQAGNIKRLAAQLRVDVITLEMEYVPPDWLRVFDIDSVSLPEPGKILAILENQ